MNFLRNSVCAKNWEENPSCFVFIRAFIQKAGYFFSHWVRVLRQLHSKQLSILTHRRVSVCVRIHNCSDTQPCSLMFPGALEVILNLQGGYPRKYWIAIEKAFPFFKIQQCPQQVAIGQKISGHDQCANIQHEWTLQSSWNGWVFIFWLNQYLSTSKWLRVSRTFL